MERKQFLQGLLNLTNKQRETLYKYCWNLKPSDIAKELKVSNQTINSHLTAARNEFKFKGENEELRNEIGEDIREILEDNKSLIRWNTISVDLKNELKELEKSEEEKPKPEPEPDPEEENGEEQEEIEYEEPELPGLVTHDGVLPQGTQHADADSWDELEQKQTQTGETQQTEDPEPPPETDGLELRGFLRWAVMIGAGLIIVSISIWVVNRCTAAPPPTPIPTRVPTAEPTRTETSPPVGQVDPPVDTETPPPTDTPTETLAPTITYTPTITPTPIPTDTPTITPTDVGLENLPLTFTGTYDEDVYWPEPMIIKIESKSDDTVSGTFLFTDRGRVTGWEGSIVHNFDDSAELARWLFVKGFDTDGIHIQVTRMWEIAGGGTTGSGDRYYFHISSNGVITGVRYRTVSRTTPSAIIDLEMVP